ncbi:ABC-three component system middle component 5 [Pedobacter gandavensis]|uniref:ABC-three component system middle component 5 n=1 Tax=Pedobacter gandavensis TaxID=2679963 RepID=UPI00293000B0|nr:ABC-three component system middle component 5 [Pedobacter gandavensis]
MTLAYHPAFDLYNCIFRMLCLLDGSKELELSFDKLRIWDFYLTFPSQVKEIQFPSELRKNKNTLFKVEDNAYEKLINPKRIFERMHSYQLAAVRCLASYGFVDAESLSRNVIKRTKKPLPVDLKEEIEGISPLKKNIIKLLVSDFVSLPLYGENGLKHRTKLIDFKYDPRT